MIRIILEKKAIITKKVKLKALLCQLYITLMDVVTVRVFFFP